MNGRHAVWILTGIALVLLLGAPAAGHSFRSMFLDLRETSGSAVEVTMKIPVQEQGFAVPVIPRFPKACSLIGPSQGERTSEALIRRFALECEGGLRGRRVSIDGLSPLVPDAAVSMRFADGTLRVAVLDSSHTAFVFGPEGRDPARGVAAYFPIGILHILTGPDHLLFVLCLMLILRVARASTSTLVGTITAFTAAHSLTLALAILGGARLPDRVVEAAIPASILLLAVELAVAPSRTRRSYTFERPWLVAFAFGLLHGFGFAGALEQMGLPESARGAALLAFNLGVEAGQLLFVSVIAVGAFAARRVLPSRLRLPLPIATAAIGAVAAYWTIARVEAGWGG